MMRFIIIISFLSILISCHKGKNNPESCNGNTRREVKICIDENTVNVDLNSLSTTITDLGKFEVPNVNSDSPRQSIELKTYTVTCVVDKVKKERDGDYHLRLKEGENYLIAESANPGCQYAKESVFHNNFVNVRSFIESNDLEGKTVTITGVAFIDIDHHYKRKQAPNNIELHPVLNISF